MFRCADPLTGLVLNFTDPFGIFPGADRPHRNKEVKAIQSMYRKVIKHSKKPNTAKIAMGQEAFKYKKKRKPKPKQYKKMMKGQGFFKKAKKVKRGSW